jgi:hypothetical protein
MYRWDPETGQKPYFTPFYFMRALLHPLLLHERYPVAPVESFVCSSNVTLKQGPITEDNDNLEVFDAVRRGKPMGHQPPMGVPGIRLQCTVPDTVYDMGNVHQQGQFCK